jgi:EmrB/QacA subfamily drug resistance transporter
VRLAVPRRHEERLAPLVLDGGVRQPGEDARPRGAAARGPVKRLALLCAVQFVLVLDVTIVGVALPSIRRDLGFSAGGLQWVVSAYVLAFGGLLLLGGRLADVLGRRRLFAAGLAGFTLASLACGLATSAGALIAARALQGAGAALATPAALALVTTAFADGRARTRALGIWTAAAPVGGATGLLVGGALTQALGWPAIFLVNVPVGVVALALTPRLLPRDADLAGGAPHRWRGAAARVDALGALLGTVAITALVLAFTRAEAGGALALGAAAVAVAAGIGFARWEHRASHPLLPPGTLRRHRALAVAAGVSLVLTAATSPPFFLVTLHLQTALGWSPTASGLGTLPVVVAVIAGAALAPRVIAARGAGTVMTAGLALIAAGTAVLTGGAFATAILPGELLYGLGLGAGSVAATTAGTAALPHTRQGLASGLLNTAAQVGTALGLALVVGIATAADVETAFAADAVLVAAAAVCVGSHRWRPRAVRS